MTKSLPIDHAALAPSGSRVLFAYMMHHVSNFETVPTPAENIIAPATFLRTAEANGNFGELFNMLNTAYAAHL